MSIAGKVVAITGGARGIGYETAARLIRQGCQVAIGDIDELRLKEAAEELKLSTYARLDVTDPESFEAFLTQVESELGPIDVLINNAGIMPAGHFEAESDAITRRQVEINILGVMFGSKTALKRMLPRNQGHIINIASLAGESHIPGLATYCGTKHAVIGFTESLRAEYVKTGVNFSLVCPTFTNTELVSGTKGVKGFRNAEPQEIAEAVAELIESPKPIRRVTRLSGAMVVMMKYLPRKAVDVTTAAFGGDSVFLGDVDQSARAAYDERIKSN